MQVTNGEQLMERELHLGARRVQCAVLALMLATAALWGYVTLEGALAWGALLLGALGTLYWGRRLTWDADRWRKHMRSRRAAARDLLRADEGGRTRPPGW